MSDNVAETKTKLIISAVVTRANGTVEDLGVICDSENQTDN